MNKQLLEIDNLKMDEKEINNNFSVVEKRYQRRKNWLKCETCNIFVNSEKLLGVHQRGKRHILAVEKTQKSETNLYCNICNIFTNGEIQLVEHINGKSHKARISELEELTEFRFYCLCYTMITLFMYIIITCILYIIFKFLF